MASISALSCISSAIDDLEFLKEVSGLLGRHVFSDEIGYLIFLRTFLMCARKWGKHVDDPSLLGALLLRIEDFIFQTIPKIHSLRLSASEGVFTDIFTACRLEGHIRSFKEDIDQWYVAFSGCSSRRFSSYSPVNIDEVLEFLDLLLEQLAVFIYARYYSELVVKPTQGLAEKLTFLKNLLHFIKLHNVEGGNLELLLTHTEGVVVNVARYVFMCKFMGYEEASMLMTKVDHCKLLQSIVPEETCKALIASNSCLSRNSRGEVDEHILKDFVDKLLISLWDILKSGTTCLVIHLRDQLQKLYEGLRFLRITLKMKPSKFDEKIRDLTADVVYDAGLAIFSLSLKPTNDDLVEQMDLVSFDLLEKLKVIQATVAEEFSERPSFNFPRTNELGFVDFLLNYMMGLTSPETDSHSLALVNYPVQSIHEELSSLRPFLRKIVELRSEDEELQSLWDRVMEVAYKVEFLIDSLLVGYILHSSSMSFDTIVNEIKIIKVEALQFDNKRFNLKVDQVTKKFDCSPSQRSKPIINDVVVGMEDEAKSVINRLTRGSRQLKIVHIVGMPGLGKTTLAKKVYNDIAAINHFHIRAWCTVSQFHNKKSLLLQILTCIDAKHPGLLFNMSEEDLAHQVRKCLLRNKYLIVLDDLWDIEAWNRLKASFPDDWNGSRVILTSRLRDVAPQDKLDQEPHSLRELTHDESWDLVKEKLCPGKIILPPELCELRKEIVDLCKGLPLTIVILAGILANVDQSGWKEVVQSLNLSNISSSEQCTATLELSYRQLPDNLKPCFLYFGGFPEDHEHTIERLIWLWVAEGFAQAIHPKSAEDVANDYMMNLIDRSLVVASKERSIGGVKSCRIHDLLHEFCITKAKEENFLQFVCGYDEIYSLYVPQYLRRLCINSKPKHLQESMLSFPTLRSLLFFELGPMESASRFELLFVSQVFKLLRVLHLSQIQLGLNFFSEIELLILLRYLAVQWGVTSIPSSIANFSNLETLILESCESRVSLPDTIWNMKKLRHLQFKDVGFGFSGGFCLPTENLDNSSELCNLDTFSTARFSWENIDKVLKKFPNVRKLKCSLFVYSAEEGSKIILNLDFLSHLKSLHLIRRSDFDRQYRYEFHFSMTIEKLTLSGFCLPWSQISVVANLSNLKVLKLLEDAFMGAAWSMEDEEFPNLVFLKLASLKILTWTALECENSFPCLKKLVLENCYGLEEIPSSLGNVPTLETIELSDCPNCASSVKKIKEEQIFSMGYTELKFISHPPSFMHMG